MRETRPQVIAHHVGMALQHSTLTMRKYGNAVRDVYEQRTPAEARAIRFHTTRDPYSDERLNAQIVKRALDDLHDLPCALEEALVLALPQPFQGECRRELAERYGELAAPIPAPGEGAPLADCGSLMKECGEALVDLSRCFRNGVVVQGESRTARLALGDLDDVIAQATSIRARIADSLAQESPVTTLKRA
jgi:hypothetical protein